MIASSRQSRRMALTVRWGNIPGIQIISNVQALTPLGIAISYLYRFVEYDGAQSKWKFRQAGVYHAYTKSTDSHLWVFLQPHPQSVFDCRVQKIARNADSTEKLLRAPFRLHEVLIDSYLGNWRWYLKEVAEDFRDEVCSFPSTGADLASGSLAPVRQGFHGRHRQNVVQH